jgi:glucose-6-phosphate 1-epimerase
VNFEIIELKNENFHAEICSYGAQLLKLCKKNDPDNSIIWLSKLAEFRKGTAIRGGIPICWPWFGASEVPGRPIQGFARLCEWILKKYSGNSLEMELPMKNVPEEWIDFPFVLKLKVVLSDSLEMELSMTNLGAVPVCISCALHTYLTVKDIEKVVIQGLQNTTYTVKDSKDKYSHCNTLQVCGEICRLYEPQNSNVTLIDSLEKRRIIISKGGSNSTMVWNPGRSRCMEINDMLDDDYMHMLCIEANNAGNDKRILYSGESHTISQKIVVL